LDVEVVKKSVPFVLQRHWWKGPIVIRFGPSTEHFDIRIDKGVSELIHFVCKNSPLENDSLVCYPKPCKDKSSMDLGSGKEPESLEPGTPENPTKDTPAFIKIIDKGNCILLDDKEEFKKVEFKGEKLRGLWIFRPENPGAKIWIMERSELPMTKELRFEFYKIDTKKRLVSGPVLIPNVADTQGDVIDEDEVEKAAHNFLKDLLSGKSEEKPVDVMHMDPTHPVELVESYLSPVDFSIGKEKVRKGTWLITVHIVDDEVWREVEEKKFLKGFSIQGSMEAVPYKPKPEEIGG